jgi:hypothetical protein
MYIKIFIGFNNPISRNIYFGETSPNEMKEYIVKNLASMMDWYYERGTEEDFRRGEIERAEYKFIMRHLYPNKEERIATHARMTIHEPHLFDADPS